MSRHGGLTLITLQLLYHLVLVPDLANETAYQLLLAFELLQKLFSSSPWDSMIISKSERCVSAC